ncbi:MAG: hypothetical protein V4440_10645 [Pseudomonadota bacterium]
MSKPENKSKENDVKDNSALPEGKADDATVSKSEVTENVETKAKDVAVQEDKKITFSKSDVKKLTDELKELMLIEFSKSLLLFPTMSASFEKLLEKAETMAKVTTKDGDHAIAGEFINLHSALAIAFNKLKSLSEKAKAFAENHKL